MTNEVTHPAVWETWPPQPGPKSGDSKKGRFGEIAKTQQQGLLVSRREQEKASRQTELRAEREAWQQEARRHQSVAAEIVQLQEWVFQEVVSTNAWNATFPTRWRMRAGYYLGPDGHRVDFWLATNNHIFYPNRKHRLLTRGGLFVYYKSRVHLWSLRMWQLERLRDQLQQAKARLMLHSDTR